MVPWWTLPIAMLVGVIGTVIGAVYALKWSEKTDLKHYWHPRTQDPPDDPLFPL